MSNDIRSKQFLKLFRNPDGVYESMIQRVYRQIREADPKADITLAASKAQRCFGVGFINTGFIGACIRDEFTYQRSEVYKTKVIWKPTFEPDMSALSIAGDGLLKISQAIPDFITEQRVHRLTGID